MVEQRKSTVFKGYVVGKDFWKMGKGVVKEVWKVKVTDGSHFHNRKFPVLTAKTGLANGLDVYFQIACIGPGSKKERAVEVTVLTR